MPCPGVGAITRCSPPVSGHGDAGRTRGRGREGEGDVTTADGNPTIIRQMPSVAEGAAIHPTFLRVGPWALSVVVASLFGLSFATSYAALYDYANELQFSREFALAFPLVLDAVIVVLAVTLLLERALGRRRGASRRSGLLLDW